MLRCVAKYLFLSELEAVFLAYSLDGFDYRTTRAGGLHAFLLQDAAALKDFSELYENSHVEFRTVLLFFTLFAYGVKRYLNEQEYLSMIDAKLEVLIPGFYGIYRKYLPVIEGALNIDLQALNTLFKQLTRAQRQEFLTKSASAADAEEVVGK